MTVVNESSKDTSIDVTLVESDIQDDIKSMKETHEEVNNDFVDEEIHIYRSNEMPTDIEISCVIKFNVYNGQQIPDKGTLVKFWEGTLPSDSIMLEGIESTRIKGFRIIDLLSATEISTGYHLEGITVTAKATPIIVK